MNRRITNTEPEMACPSCGKNPTLRRHSLGLRYECVCPPTHSIQIYEDAAAASWRTIAFMNSFIR